MEMAKDEDGLTELPDMLRHHILSLLPRKYAIRIGVLSKRWKDLWKSRFPLPTSTMNFGRSFYEGKLSDQQDLIKEITEVMQQHGNNKIEVFHLFIHPSVDKDIVSAWIQQASSNGVEEASLHFSAEDVQNQNQNQNQNPSQNQNQNPNPIISLSMRPKFLMNANVFTGNLLVVLSLCNCKLEGDFSSIPFHSLERLCFEKSVINETVMRELASNCHVLSRFELKDCIGIQDLVLTSPALHRLRKLVVANCWKLRTVEVSSPVLLSINVSSQIPCLLVIRDVSCLEDASMVSEVRAHNIKYYNPREDAGRRFVNSMALSSNKLEYAFGSSSCPYGDIKYLNGLQVVVVNNAGLVPLYQYPGQRIFPCLEKLFVEFPQSYEDASKDFYRAIEIGPPTGAFQKLKVVKLSNFKCMENEILLLRFILAVAPKLRIVIVVFCHEMDGQNCSRKRESLSNDVTRMTKASEQVDVMVCCTSQYSNNNNLSHNLLVSDWPIEHDHLRRNLNPFPYSNDPDPPAPPPPPPGAQLN